MTLRDSLPDINLRSWLRDGGRTTAQVASITAFIVLLGVTMFAAFGASSFLLAGLATFVLFFMLRAVLPAERIDNAVRELMNGDAGIRAYEWATDRLSGLADRVR